jgi:FixJ family two-component response regulator
MQNASGVSDPEATVFVVYDDASIRRSTERLVVSMGFDVRTFASAKQFTDHARVDDPSCLVVDVHLPGASGLDLQRELAWSGVEIPIIFITGRDSVPMSVRAKKEARSSSSPSRLARAARIAPTPSTGAP